MLNRTLLYSMLSGLLLCSTASTHHAQSHKTFKLNAKLSANRLENVRIETRGPSHFFSDLALRYDIPVGLEVALNDDESAAYGIDLKSGTLSELLTQFVSEHPQYDWDMNDGVINVFPKYHRDPILAEMLTAKIPSFSIEENTGCRKFEESLVATAEVARIAKAYNLEHAVLNFSGLYFPQLGKRFKGSFQDTAVESILNQVIRDSPVARIWIVKRSVDDQTFFIKLNARQEPDSEQSDVP